MLVFIMKFLMLCLFIIYVFFSSGLYIVVVFMCILNSTFIKQMLLKTADY